MERRNRPIWIIRWQRARLAAYLVSATWRQRHGRDELIERTPHAAPTLVEHVCVDHHHRRADIAVAQQFLDGSDVVARFEQVGRE